jgi:hypothetical protein
MLACGFEIKDQQSESSGSFPSVDPLHRVAGVFFVLES